MGEVLVKDLIEAFKKAVIIDMEKKTLWFINEGKLKVYPRKMYNELLSKLDL